MSRGTLSAVIEWSPGYELGLEQVDRQHEALVSMINDAWQAVVRRDKAEALRVIRNLEQYTVVHFTEEEAFMRSIAYPHFESHKVLHDNFVRRIGEEAGTLEQGGELSMGLLHFLKDWLVSHILHEDKKYADYQSASSRPRSGLGAFFRRFVGA